MHYIASVKNKKNILLPYQWAHQKEERFYSIFVSPMYILDALTVALCHLREP